MPDVAKCRGRDDDDEASDLFEFRGKSDKELAPGKS